MSSDRRAGREPGFAAGGQATDNVLPLAAAAYVDKTDCFCFTERTLAAGQRADMPVRFHIDPEIDSDPDTSGIETLTLSHTFFEAEPAAAGLDAAGATGEARVN